MSTDESTLGGQYIVRLATRQMVAGALRATSGLAARPAAHWRRVRLPRDGPVARMLERATSTGPGPTWLRWLAGVLISTVKLAELAQTEGSRTRYRQRTPDDGHLFLADRPPKVTSRFVVIAPFSGLRLNN